MSWAALGLSLAMAVWPGLPSARAEIVQGVVAVVNDEVISRYDLEQRMRLVLSTSGLQPSADALRRIEPQVLRSLIDERLQLQEAKRQKVTVNEEEVDDALRSIAEQNNMSLDQIEAVMAKGNVDINTLKNQIRAEMAWQRLVGQRFGSRVYVSEGDVKIEYARFTEALAQPQYLVSEIFLPIDNPDQEEEMAHSAQGLVNEVRRGAPFSGVARQFSRATSASAGGDLGWVQSGVLDPALDKAVTRMTPGQVSDPIRTAGGFHVIYLRSRREGGTAGQGALKHVHLKQIVVPIGAKASEEAEQHAAEKAATVAEAISGCGSVERAAASDASLVVSDLGNLAADQIAPFIQNAVADVGIGEASRPIRGPMGIHILVVCSKETGPAPKAAMPTMEDIETRMINQQLGLMSRRYLRDLRRDAVVEVRGFQIN